MDRDSVESLTRPTPQARWMRAHAVACLAVSHKICPSLVGSISNAFLFLWPAHPLPLLLSPLPPFSLTFRQCRHSTSPHPQLVRRFLVSFYVLDIFCVYVYSMPREYILHFDSRVNCYRVQNIFQIFCLFICSFT